MKYRLYGITLDTPFPCPELLPASGEVDVHVTLGKIDPAATAWRGEGVCYKAAPGKYLLSVKNVADYFVVNGDEVVIDPAPSADENALRLFLYNEVIAALLMQRGCLLLKGCVVERHGQAFAFTGPTPTGKTMLAAELARQGFRIVSDGFICLSGTETPLAQPGYPWLRVWEKSLDVLGISPTGLKPVRTGMQRFYLPLQHSFCNEAVRLETIHVLAFHNRAELLIEEAKGAEKLFNLMFHRYHAEWGMPLDRVSMQNGMAVSLANLVNVKIIRYNDTLMPFREFVDHMKNEVKVTVS